MLKLQVLALLAGKRATMLTLPPHANAPLHTVMILQASSTSSASPAAPVLYERADCQISVPSHLTMQLVVSMVEDVLPM